MIVIGIDPGTASTGFGVVKRAGSKLLALDGGLIKTSSEQTMEHRLSIIYERIGELINLHSPDCLAIEELYFGQNVRSAAAVGQARGVALLAAGQAGIKAYSYTPQKIKSSVCGHGGAGKEQVQRMVQRLLALSELPRPDHMADALAVAICHANGAPLLAAIST